MNILGIETSCDETAAAVYGDRGLLGHTLHSQVALHAEYGGVVPELASRDHVRRINPLIREVLAQAGLTPQQLDGVAYPMSAAMPGVLPRAHFSLDGGRLRLHLPEDLAFLAGEHLAGRLEQLAGVAGIKSSEIVAK